MIKAILFDCDGVIIRKEKYFSQRLKEERGTVIDLSGHADFFKNEFLLCQKGRADLRQELAKLLDVWGWTGTAEELMEYWFSGERDIDLEIRDYIISLRNNGIKTYLSTNNEKYRLNYLWEEVGLKNIFDGKLPSCELGALKSENLFWQEAYKHLSPTEKSEILVWDDAESAIVGAKDFGFNAELYINFLSLKNRISQKYSIQVIQDKK